ncbi:MAG: hypothetical protein K0S76_48 [Herbinix sp.]|jgi:uncharacterized protein YjgD (DUF1641 family)|nr:hypothetical protein [Herbinix sp.]
MEQTNQMETYIVLLEASLVKKRGVLDQLIDLSNQQEAQINDDMNDDSFNRIIDEKDNLIKTILQLDEGFEQIYQRIKDEFTINQKNHQSEIKKLQELIKEVIDRGVQLQVTERRNKAKFEAYLQTKRKGIKNVKLNSQTATSYYKNMANQNQQESYFFDKKK